VADLKYSLTLDEEEIIALIQLLSIRMVQIGSCLRCSCTTRSSRAAR
jgi:hypothetical protein